MKILFLDQSGKPGGAELFLLDIAKAYRDRCLVCLFTDGPFREFLQQQNIPVRVLINQGIRVRKESSWLEGVKSLQQLIPLSITVAKLSREYDLIYANTQKALVVGALASLISRRPLIFHLHDILSLEHFSPANRRLAVTLANRCAKRVIATSQATRDAFIEAGGRPEIVSVLYNGFDPQLYETNGHGADQLRQQLGLEGRFVVGHFSRLSPWKGQHVLVEALMNCPADVTALFVGDALYGEQDYVQQLQQQVTDLKLQNRVCFLGFQSNVVPLMQTCNVVAHTSTSPEPFGRVIVEAMLCGRPVIASQAGGAVELIESGSNGWLVPPEKPDLLANAIAHCYYYPEESHALAERAQREARQRFHLDVIHQQLAQILGSGI